LKRRIEVSNLIKKLTSSSKGIAVPTRVTELTPKNVLRHLQTITINHIASNLSGASPVSLDVYELAVQCTNAEIIASLGERTPLEPWMLAHLMYMQPDGRTGPLNINGKTFIFTVLGIPTMTNYNWTKREWVVRDQRSHDLLRLEGPDVEWCYGWAGPRVLAMSVDCFERNESTEEISHGTKCIEMDSESNPNILSQESNPNCRRKSALC
jgi:hypothetical protein